MQLIEGSIRSYAWGSHTVLSELSGRPSPTEHPEAEMWFGAHPAAPCTVVSEGVTLDQFIALAPETQVGQGRTQLPFLLKILAAQKALSLQAHPSKAQAEEGFAAENAAGIALDAFNRNYKDDNHKPELVVALSPFSALAGFRPVAKTRALLDLLDVPQLASFQHLLGSGIDAVDIRGIFTTWVALPQELIVELLPAVVTRCKQLIAFPPQGCEQWMRQSCQAVVTLAQQYPGDVGVLCSLLLNAVTLQPGQGLYVDAGQLHAYLEGTAIEIMANSDNVLRSGLTAKHIDVPELMKVVSFEPVEDPRLCADQDGMYHTAASDFALQRVTAGQSTTVTGPAIVLAVGKGTVTLHDASSRTPLDLGSGHAVWVASCADPVHVKVGNSPDDAVIPAQAFVARG